MLLDKPMYRPNQTHGAVYDAKHAGEVLEKLLEMEGENEDSDS